MVRGSPNPLHFGLPARLRKTRKQSGLKRKALGHRVGRDPKVTAKVEAAERIPTVGTLARLAAALGVAAGWLGSVSYTHLDVYKRQAWLQPGSPF